LFGLRSPRGRCQGFRRQGFQEWKNAYEVVHSMERRVGASL
jgi:hypothetical protein